MKIVSFYDIKKYSSENRVYSLATVAVIDYLCKALIKIGENVEIISASESKNTKGDYPFRSEEIENGVILTQVHSKGYNTIIGKELGKIKNRLWLVKYLLNNTQNNERIIFIDSPVLYEPLILFKLFARKKNIKIIYFASEVYQYVIKMNFIKKIMEWHLFYKADRLIVSTILLNNIINKTNKPYLILNGTYSIPDKKEKMDFNDDKIHIVYAGIINDSKGANNAVDIAKYLNEKYFIHILGFGSENSISQLEKRITESNLNNKCTVKYEGIKRGDEFYQFLQSCDIGLCSQDIDTKYNDTSFPSKVLTYLSNGLRVVSVELKPVKTSDVGDIIFYAKSSNPQDLANAIRNIDFSVSYDSRRVVEELDNSFTEGLKELIYG